MSAPAQSGQEVLLEIPFGGLSNSEAQIRVPAGRSWSQQNCTVDRGILEGGLLMGNAIANASANADDVVLGFGYGSYKGAVEALVVVQPHGSGQAALYVINLNQSAPITSLAVQKLGGTTTVTDLRGSTWLFTQYIDKIYAINLVDSGGVSDGMYRKTIGTRNSWEKVVPEFHIPITDTPSTSRPDYYVRPFSGNGGDILRPSLASLWGESPTYDSANASGFYIDEPSNTVNIKYSRLISSRNTEVEALPVRLSSAIDLSRTDFVAFRVLLDDGIGLLNLDSMLFGISTSPTPAALGDLQLCSKATHRFKAISAGSPNSYGGIQDLWAWGDLSAFTMSSRTAVAALFFKWYVDQNTALRAWTELRSPVFGGVRLHDLQNGVDSSGYPSFEQLDIEYAVSYYNSSTGAESPATKTVLQGAVAAGISPFGALPPMGAWVQLNPLINLPGSYDKLRIYRSVWVKKRGVAQSAPIDRANYTISWYLLTTLDNANDGSGNPPQYIDKARASEVQQGTAITLTFGDIPFTMNATALTTWMGHFVFGNDRQLFFSWAGQPTLYLPTAGQSVAPDISETDQGRTLFMSPDRAENAVGLIGLDILFEVGERSCFVQIGDSALGATPPRRVPNSRGGLGPRSQCAQGYGVLVASPDALWHYTVNRFYYATQDQKFEHVEFTREVRASWRRLLGQDTSAWKRLVVAEHLDEIYAFLDTRYLKFTRNGRWEEGTLPYAVVAAWSSTPYSPSAPKYQGLLVATNPGRVFELKNYALEKEYGNTISTPDNGAHATWSWNSGLIQLPQMARFRPRILKLVGSGTPKITINMYDSSDASVFETEEILKPAPEQIWQFPISAQPGNRMEIICSGNALLDDIQDLKVVVEAMGPGFGL